MATQASSELAAFLALPVETRKKIVLVADEMLERAQAAAKPGQLSGEDLGGLAVYGSLLFGVGALVLPLAGLAYNAFTSHRASWQPLILGRKQTSELRLEFPPGHPQDKVLYVAHPLDSRVYYPAAEFHLRLMLNKANEVVRILTALRARSIEIRHQRGYSQDIASKVNLPAGYLVASADAGTKTSSSSDYALKLEYKPRKGGKRTLPPDLVWYPVEQAWHLPIEEAQRGQLSNFALTVKSDNDYGVNTQFTTEALKAKLALGGTFVAHETTEWVISAQF